MPSQARKCETRCVGVWCSGWTVIFWIYTFCIIRGWILPRLLPGRRFCDFRWEEVWFFFLWRNPDCKHTSKWLQPSAFILAASTLPLAPILRWFCRLVWYYRSFSTQGWLLFMQCKMVFFFWFHSWLEKATGKDGNNDNHTLTLTDFYGDSESSTIWCIVLQILLLLVDFLAAKDFGRKIMRQTHPSLVICGKYRTSRSCIH